MHSFVWLNLFDYFVLTEHYASLHLHVEGGEYIADETRPHTKYTGLVNPLFPNSFGSSNPVCPHREVYPKLELV